MLPARHDDDDDDVQKKNPLKKQLHKKCKYENTMNVVSNNPQWLYISLKSVIQSINFFLDGESLC